MILGRQTHCSRGWLVQLVAALVALLATNLSCAPPSATADAGAETRVGAPGVVVEPLVGPPESVSAGQQLGNELAGPGIVVATEPRTIAVRPRLSSEPPRTTPRTKGRADLWRAAVLPRLARTTTTTSPRGPRRSTRPRVRP